MPITRQLFEISTNATKCDTGVQLNGELIQTRWEQTGTPDTGADLQMFVQQREGDTGDGFPVINDNDCLGADFFRQFRTPMHNADGVALDTGGDLVDRIVLANERLRVRVIPAGGTVQGRLYTWIKS